MTLAEHKTEVVFISKRRKQTLMKIRIDEQTILSQPALKQLGVTIDQKLNFKPHLEIFTTKASGEYRPPKRIVSSIMLFAAHVLSSALEHNASRKKIEGLY